MRRQISEILVGLFMLGALLAFLVLAFKISGLSSYSGRQGYYVKAAFDNIGSLKVRAPVTIAGVRVGEVTDIDLNSTDFKATVTIRLNTQQDKIPDDSNARILTEGLLGSNYISLTPGFDNTYLHNGSRISDTQPALILENLIGQLIFNMDKKK